MKPWTSSPWRMRAVRCRRFCRKTAATGLAPA
jgi:hypothetical protein